MRIVRNEKGQFAHFDLHVRNGETFICNEINNLDEIAHPLTEKPLTDNQLLVNSTYKRNTNKTNKNKKEISCASSDALASFILFWTTYPRKKDKKKAFRIWTDLNCHEKANTIIEKLKTQIAHDPQWQDAHFIPYPTTYLRNERWEDEVEVVSSKIIPPPSRNEIRSTVKDWAPGNPDYDRVNNCGRTIGIESTVVS
jgi:hypothetical protein